MAEENYFTGSAVSTGPSGRGVQQSLRSLHAMKKQVSANPEAIIADFIERTRESLGVPGGALGKALFSQGGLLQGPRGDASQNHFAGASSRIVSILSQRLKNDP